MTRIVLLVSLFLLVAGLELAAGMVTGTFDQIVQGLDALTRFPETGELSLRFLGGFMLLTAGMVGTILAAWSGFKRARLHKGKGCPRCGNGTKRIRRRLRHRVLTRILGVRVVRRRCTDCGWMGLARVESRG